MHSVSRPSCLGNNSFLWGNPSAPWLQPWLVSSAEKAAAHWPTTKLRAEGKSATKVTPEWAEGSDEGLGHSPGQTPELPKVCHHSSRPARLLGQCGEGDTCAGEWFKIFKVKDTLNSWYTLQHGSTSKAFIYTTCVKRQNYGSRECFTGCLRLNWGWWGGGIPGVGHELRLDFMSKYTEKYTTRWTLLCINYTSINLT